MSALGQRLARLETQTGVGAVATPEERAEFWRLMDADDKASLAALDVLTECVEARGRDLPAGERWRLWSDKPHEEWLKELR